MDSDGNSLDTLDSIPVKSPNEAWADHLEICARRLREISQMTALPHNVKQLNYIANDLELLVSKLR